MSYEVVRTTSIAADPARVHALIDDFRRWPEWSPWEHLDPNLSRTYTGAETGVGSHYAWKGNKKAGEGSMEITGSTPQRIDITVSFLKPFKATNQTDLTLTPTADGGTDVAWRMTGNPTGFAAFFMRFMNMDKLIGGDFEKGLAQLKAAAEA